MFRWFEGGSSITGVFTGLRSIRRGGNRIDLWPAGPTGNTRSCVNICAGRRIGSRASRDGIRSCGRTVRWVRGKAPWREPYERGRSRTVPWEPRGEIPRATHLAARFNLCALAMARRMLRAPSPRSSAPCAAPIRPRCPQHPRRCARARGPRARSDCRAAPRPRRASRFCKRSSQPGERAAALRTNRRGAGQVPSGPESLPENRSTRKA